MTTKVLKPVNIQDRNCLVSTNPEDCCSHNQMCNLMFFDQDGICRIAIPRNIPCSPEGLTTEDAYHYLVFFGLAHEQSTLEAFAETFEMRTPPLSEGIVYFVKIKPWVKKNVIATVWDMDNEVIKSERERYPNSPLYGSAHSERGMKIFTFVQSTISCNTFVWEGTPQEKEKYFNKWSVVSGTVRAKTREDAVTIMGRIPRKARILKQSADRPLTALQAFKLGYNQG